MWTTKTCKPGDKVRCKGKTLTIAKIISQDYYERGASDDGWLIEFIDTKGSYHYWKQYIDGGELIES